MRRLLAVVMTAMVLAGCSGQGSTSNDPYQIVNASVDASWNLVQVNIGASGTADGKTVSVDPSAIQFVVDTKGKRAAFHVSLPVADLGASASDLAGLGITGSTLDLDVVYDGQALYAKGPVVSSLLTLLLAQSGGTTGDLSGWVQLATKAELDTLATSLAGSLGQGVLPSLAIPSFAVPSGHTADSIKQALSDAGVTLTYVGSETKNGKSAYHLSVAIDAAKLKASKAFGAADASQLAEVEDALGQVTLSGDLWIATDTSHVVEVDLHVRPGPNASPSPSGPEQADVQIAVSEPTDDSALKAPATFTPVDLSSILGQALQMFGSGINNP
ncbi:MAG TPA: hypothetical protein VFW20_07950 [Candidatus Limnocylindrales bacterium]|nr:hypothetical protein [Candidatus Limnocylindrales bacterium]